MDDNEYRVAKLRLRYEALAQKADRKYRLIFTGIVSAVVAVLGIAVPALIQFFQLRLEDARHTNELSLQREIAETNALGSFITDGLDRNINNRIRFADYFASLIRTSDQRQLWIDYKAHLTKTRDEGQKQLADIYDKLDAASQDKSINRREAQDLDIQRTNLEAMLGDFSKVNYKQGNPNSVSSTCGNADFNNFTGKSVKLTEEDIFELSKLYSLSPNILKAFIQVEGDQFAFLTTGQPIILFERQVFSRLTKSQFDSQSPDISSSQPGGYLAGAAEYGRLLQAMSLDCDAALSSTDWGKFGILGSNYKLAGYSTVEDLALASMESERNQLEMALKYVKATGMDDALRKNDWKTFARAYNGTGFEANRYPDKFATAYSSIVSGVGK